MVATSSHINANTYTHLFRSNVIFHEIIPWIIIFRIKKNTLKSVCLRLWNRLKGIVFSLSIASITCLISNWSIWVKYSRPGGQLITAGLCIHITKIKKTFSYLYLLNYTILSQVLCNFLNEILSLMLLYIHETTKDSLDNIVNDW